MRCADHASSNALRRRVFFVYWLLEFLVLSAFALGQQSTESLSGMEPYGDPSRLPAYTVAEPSTTGSLPDPNSPSPEVCANGAADSADRVLQSEWTAGQKLATDIELHIALISDPYVTEYLNRLEHSIVLNSNLRGCFVVKLVKDVEANAYSYPGGFLYVTTGMILDAENEAGLVAALAHETGHVAARHFTKIQGRRRLWNRFSWVGGPPGYALGWRIGALFALRQSRNAEFEADRLALKYQVASGYDPRELARLLQDLFQQEGEPASFFSRLLDTHPSTDARAKRVTHALSHLQSRTDYVVDTSEFQKVKSQVANLMGVANPDVDID